MYLNASLAPRGLPCGLCARGVIKLLGVGSFCGHGISGEARSDVVGAHEIVFWVSFREFLWVWEGEKLIKVDGFGSFVGVDDWIRP